MTALAKTHAGENPDSWDAMMAAAERAIAGYTPRGPLTEKPTALSERAWEFIALYAIRLGVSESEALERVIRSNELFVSEQDE